MKSTNLTLFHGSENIIKAPQFGLGKEHNDFGLGFYCTKHQSLAKEWAVNSLRDGYCNEYSLNTEHLNILRLNTEEYSILNWIAILVQHRIFSLSNPVANRARKYLIENFGINVNAFDLIIGYRADDSYYDYADSFINNAITVQQLALAMQLGDLGEQYVIKSKFAFSQLEFKGYALSKKEDFYPIREQRNFTAAMHYLDILENEDDGLYIQDIIRGGIKNDDPSIPRNICK